MKIAIFLSAAQVAQSYHDATYQLGYELGQAGHTLVFGGYSKGMMRSIADGFADAKASIIGVVPDFLESSYVKHSHLQEVHHAKELSDRKSEMIRLSDAFIALPGGTGTLDELFDVLALKSTRRIHAPVIIYNIDGFYDPLISQLQQMRRKGFIYDELSELFFVASQPQDVIDYLTTIIKGD